MDRQAALPSSPITAATWLQRAGRRSTHVFVRLAALRAAGKQRSRCISAAAVITIGHLAEAHCDEAYLDGALRQNGCGGVFAVRGGSRTNCECSQSEVPSPRLICEPTGHVLRTRRQQLRALVWPGCPVCGHPGSSEQERNFERTFQTINPVWLSRAIQAHRQGSESPGPETLEPAAGTALRSARSCAGARRVPGARFTGVVPRSRRYAHFCCCGCLRARPGRLYMVVGS
jgi:hypothetical protein